MKYVAKISLIDDTDFDLLTGLWWHWTDALLLKQFSSCSIGNNLTELTKLWIFENESKQSNIIKMTKSKLLNKYNVQAHLYDSTTILCILRFWQISFSVKCLSLSLKLCVFILDPLDLLIFLSLFLFTDDHLDISHFYSP